MTPLAAYENLRTFSRRWGGQEVPEPFPIGQRTQCGLFHLSEVSRKCAPNDLFDQLGGTSQSLLQAHFAYAWNDAFSRLGGLSLGLCCQGENRRDVCVTTAVFSRMENQVKRQRKINITNPPPVWGPQTGGGGRRRILHTFSNITRCFLKKKARGPILKGVGKLSCAVWKFTGQK